ncbi:hypothetical protein [Pseudonocardia sichuanensis]
MEVISGQAPVIAPTRTLVLSGGRWCAGGNDLVGAASVILPTRVRVVRICVVCGSP